MSQQCIYFSVWPALLSIVPVRFIYVIAVVVLHLSSLLYSIPQFICPFCCQFCAKAYWCLRKSQADFSWSLILILLLFKIWYFVHHGVLALLLIKKKHNNIALKYYLPWVPVLGHPLNFAPEVSASLISLWLHLLEMDTWSFWTQFRQVEVVLLWTLLYMFCGKHRFAFL